MKINVVVSALIALLSVYLICAYLFSVRLISTYSDKYVEAGTAKRRFMSLLVHAGEEHYIKCGGHVYFHVRGLEPYYLKVPGSESILFVTESADGSVIFYIFNAKTRAETEIAGDKSDFGGNIGTKRTLGEPYTDFIDHASPNDLVLGTQYPGFRKLTFLSLTQKRIERVESR